MHHHGCDDGGRRPSFSFCLTAHFIPISTSVSSGQGHKIMVPRFFGPYHEMGAVAENKSTAFFYGHAGRDSPEKADSRRRQWDGSIRQTC